MTVECLPGSYSFLLMREENLKYWVWGSVGRHTFQYTKMSQNQQRRGKANLKPLPAVMETLPYGLITFIGFMDFSVTEKGRQLLHIARPTILLKLAGWQVKRVL